MINIVGSYQGYFNRTDTFRTPTSHDVAGRWCKKIFGTWRSCEADPTFVSKIYADHLDYRIPKLGMGQDKNCIRKRLGDELSLSLNTIIGLTHIRYHFNFHICYRFLILVMCTVKRVTRNVSVL